MSYEYEGSGNYLGDGVYANWWSWVEDERLEAETLMVKKLSQQWFDSVDDSKYSPSELLNSMFKDTIKKGCQLATRRYCELEFIQLKYADAICGGCKPADLIAAKLKRYNIFEGIEEVKRLDLLIAELKKYRNDLTAYFKVHEVQLHIHREMQLKNGGKSHLAMDKKIMREILSILRLFFLTIETKKMDLNDFVNFSTNYEKTINHAKSFIPKYCLESSKYSESWSLKHQHSLLYYLPKEMRDFIQILIQLRSEKSKEEIYRKIEEKITSYHLQL